MSFEPPEAGHGHHHGTGHRWLDIALAGSAMVVSVISLFVAIEHGQVMKELVEANKKMVAANSWPELEFSNSVDTGKLSSTLENRGVGPARIKTYEWLVDGKPVSTWPELIRACCADVVHKGEALHLSASSVMGQVLPAREKINLFTLEDPPGKPELRQSMIRAIAARMERRACYCSVFDECWVVSTGDAGEPKRVGACPAVKTPFVGFDQPIPNAALSAKR